MAEIPTTISASGSAPEFFSSAWAALVRTAVDDGPTAEARTGKLPSYWNWVDRARHGYDASWALGVRQMPPHGGPAYLLLTWADGRCVDAEVVDGLRTAAAATYVLSAEHADWVALLEGYDPGRAVMYRRLLLERGDVLTFFRSVYFVIESLTRLVGVPATIPVTDPAALSR